MRPVLFLFAAFLVLLLVPISAQQQPAAQEEATIKVTTQEVVLDLVVRDKKGKLVRDLKPEEIEVLENDAPQQVKAFRLIEGSADTAKQVAQQRPQGADPLREPRLITLVFSGMGVDGKRFLRQATQDLIKMATEPNLYYSVYTIDQNLHLLQPFTTNYELVKDQIQKAQTAQYAQFAERSSEAVKSLIPIAAKMPELQQQAASSRSVADGMAFAEAAMARMQIDTIKASEEGERGYSARSTLFALAALAHSQAQLPGRKTILYFTEWFNVGDPEVHILRSLISTANRANVSFYCVDSKGLTTYSQESVGRGDISGTARESANQTMSASRGSTADTKAQMQMDDRLQSGLRASPLGHMRELSEETGGFLIAETNDLKAPLRRSLEEVRTYYEAAYTPQIAKYDGAFRRLTVRVKRPDTVVSTRSGYFALPPGKPLSGFEVPLLAAAAGTPGASPSLAFASAALRFKGLGGDPMYTLALEVPMKALEFRPIPNKKTSLVHATFLALIKDANGEVAGRFSQERPLEVTQDKVDALKEGNMLQTFRTPLKPGKYVLEAAVSDKLTSATGLQRTEFVVPEKPQGLAVSNITVVRKLDAGVKAQEPDDPFAIPAGKLTPELSNTIKAGQPRVSFYFVVYSAPGAGQPELTMGFYQDGQLLGEVKPALGSADKQGRIPYVAAVPGSNFPAGKYQMKATVKQGSQTAQETIDFTVN